MRSAGGQWVRAQVRVGWIVNQAAMPTVSRRPRKPGASGPTSSTPQVRWVSRSRFRRRPCAVLYCPELPTTGPREVAGVVFGRDSAGCGTGPRTPRRPPGTAYAPTPRSPARTPCRRPRVTRHGGSGPRHHQAVLPLRERGPMDPRRILLVALAVLLASGCVAVPHTPAPTPRPPPRRPGPPHSRPPPTARPSRSRRRPRPGKPSMPPAFSRRPLCRAPALVETAPTARPGDLERRRGRSSTGVVFTGRSVFIAWRGTAGARRGGVGR